MQIDLNYPEPIPVSLEPAKTMLLIVDMENEDAHPTGKRYMGEAVDQDHSQDRCAAAASAPSGRSRRPHAVRAQTRCAGVYPF